MQSDRFELKDLINIQNYRSTFARTLLIDIWIVKLQEKSGKLTKSIYLDKALFINIKDDVVMKINCVQIARKVFQSVPTKTILFQYFHASRQNRDVRIITSNYLSVSLFKVNLF